METGDFRVRKPQISNFKFQNMVGEA